ncbi:MAG: lysylphosphatidylglycerol synthase domain-containing protein [Myxococcota bacterium]
MKKPGPGIIKRTGGFVPVLVAVALCSWLIQHVTWPALSESLSRGRFDWFLPLAIVYAFVSFQIETVGLAVLFTRTVIRTPLQEVRVVKSVTQFMGMLNVWLGQAGMGYYYSRRSGLPMTYLSGVFALLLYTDLSVMFLFCGMIYKPGGEPYQFLYASVIAAGLILLPLFLVARKVSEWRLGDLAKRSVWFTKNGSRQLFAPLFLIPIADYLVIFAARFIRYPIRAAFVLLSLRAFHVDLPVMNGLVVSSFILLAGSLPLTPMGVGVLQAAGLFLLHGLAPEADVLAGLLMVSVTVVTGNFVFGLYNLRGGIALIQNPTIGEDK